ncbi:hypothetical protein Tco_1434482 [Tanacetum coccineum]
MFHATLKLTVETPEQPFIPLTSLKYIQPFLKIVGYQGLVDKVSAFFTKNLAQPWPTMFKVFHRFYVDYASLLWWDFIHYVQQKKNVIQYPRFTKLIITNIMKKYESIHKRLKEDYHSIKDNTPLVNAYTIGMVTVKGMMIPDELITNIRSKQQKPISTTIPPPNDDQECDEIHSATLLSLAIHKTAKIVEEQENVAAVKEKILEEYVENIVEGADKESYASEFADTVLLEKEDFDNRIEPMSHKENPKNIDDDETKDNKKDDDYNDDDDQDGQKSKDG